MTKAYTTQVPIGSKALNIFGNAELERAPGHGHYFLYGRYPTGQGTLELTARVAGDLIADALPINIGAGAPIKPDDHLVTLDVVQGDKVIVNLEEVGGVTATTPSIRAEFVNATPQEIQAALGLR